MLWPQDYRFIDPSIRVALFRIEFAKPEADAEGIRQCGVKIALGQQSLTERATASLCVSKYP